MALNLGLPLLPPIRNYALGLPLLPPIRNYARRRTHPPCGKSQRRHALSPVMSSPILRRRSGNFQPSLLNDNFIQSLSTGLMDDVHVLRREKLKGDVSRLIVEENGLFEQLELVDSLQQLGLAYQFEDEIKGVLCCMHTSLDILEKKLKEDVHSSSLLFRLLRQYGFGISQDVVIKSFEDEKVNIMKPGFGHGMNIKGMLSLYEATFLAEEGEQELEDCRVFISDHLRDLRVSSSDHHHHQLLARQVERALELPLHWRTPRLNSLWFIQAYESKHNMDPRLLELAKLDFNMVQNIHRIELKDVSRWWRNLGLACDKLDFARDWPVESYLWTVGLAPEPHFSRCRKELAKTVCFLHVVDDIYDVYGSLDELELFTNAVQRWEVAAIDQLPEYMKICFLALFNTINDVAYTILKDKGLDILQYLKRAWSDICKAFLVEARWHSTGYIPPLEEYMDNAWISVAAPLSLIFAQCLSEDLNLASLENLKFYPHMTQYSSTIFRLYDDLGTSKAELQRGDVPKSIQCCMNEEHMTEMAATEKMKDLIYKNWKLLNGEHAATSKFEESFKSVVMNLPRMAHFMYSNRDGHGKPNLKMKDLITSLLIQPIPL